MSKSIVFKDEIIDKIEQAYGGKFVLDHCLPAPNNQWSLTTAAIFYKPRRSIKERFGLKYDNYYALFIDGEGKIMITSGSFIRNVIIDAIKENGVYYYSRHRHDLVETPKGKWIDGGRDYTRGSVNTVRLKVSRGKLIEV